MSRSSMPAGGAFTAACYAGPHAMGQGKFRRGLLDAPIAVAPEVVFTVPTYGVASPA
jgi:hypothetical protein